MGARHLILVFYKGEYRIAQYGEWDGDPSVQGAKILDFIRSQDNLARLITALNTPGRIYNASPEQIEAAEVAWDLYIPVRQHAEENKMDSFMHKSWEFRHEAWAWYGREQDGLCTLERRTVGADSQLYFPEPDDDVVKPEVSLMRDTSAHILNLVAYAKDPVAISRNLFFISDNVACEWAYVVDLDCGSFEVYCRGVERPQWRFGREEGIIYTQGPGLMAEFQLGKLPVREEFLRACKPPSDALAHGRWMA